MGSNSERGLVANKGGGRLGALPCSDRRQDSSRSCLPACVTAVASALACDNHRAFPQRVRSGPCRAYGCGRGRAARQGLLEEKTQDLMVNMQAVLPLIVTDALNALGAIVILLIGRWPSGRATLLVVRVLT